jgi:hypothetical protein
MAEEITVIIITNECEDALNSASSEPVLFRGVSYEVVDDLPTSEALQPRSVVALQLQTLQSRVVGVSQYETLQPHR